MKCDKTFLLYPATRHSRAGGDPDCMLNAVISAKAEITALDSRLRGNDGYDGYDGYGGYDV